MMVRAKTHSGSMLSTLLIVAGITFAWSVSADQPAQLTTSALTSWLAAYGDAWESRDPDKAARLFAEDSSYQVTPYKEPHIGQDGVREYWAGVTENQRNVQFDYEILGISGNTGTAHWSAEFDVESAGIHVKLDGIFVLEFDQNGKCQRLREWWHSETEDIKNGD